MNIITLDFETHFSDDYSLSKMTTEAYVRDPRFEVLGCAIRYETGKLEWIGQPFIEAALLRILCKADDLAILCHHAHFDGLILSHHFGLRPALWLDTLSMARLVHGNNISVSLENLARLHGLGGKTVNYTEFKNRRWADLDDHARQSLADGCKHDCALTWRLFRLLCKEFPREELGVIDLTVRMFTEPTLCGNVEKLRGLAESERVEKARLMAELGVTAAELQSPAKFCALLEREGIEIETKEGKNGPIPAIAKSDRFMRELTESADSRVAALADARLSVRSTIDETRAGRLGAMAGRGPLAVYLGYCGAHTLRWGGGDKVNFQNFRRGGDLRRAIEAPPGHNLAIVDLSQVECRTLEWFAGEEQALDDFRRGVDPYCGIASQFCGREITKADKAERGMGKQIRLSCGYGAGGDSIVTTAARGLYGPPVTLSAAEGLKARDLYRSQRPGVVKAWRQGDLVLGRLAQAIASSTWGPANVLRIAGPRIIGPNGLYMTYELRWDGVERQYFRRTRNGWVRVWGGVLIQNVMEFLCRIILSQAMLRINAHGIRIALCTHDEVVCVIRDNSDKLDLIVEEMKKTPEWAPGLPLDAEGHLSKVYEK